MKIKHKDRIPQISASAYIAPNATICGDVRIGKESRILHNCAIIAEGGSIEIGENCIILENVVIRSTERFSVIVGNNVLIGPNSHLVGCKIEDCVFIATGASVFHGSHIGYNSEVRINAVVHLKTYLPPNSIVPINWVAVGNPVKILSPDKHNEIWDIQKPLNFPLSVYGIDRPEEGETIMTQITEYYSKILATHKDDEILKK